MTAHDLLEKLRAICLALPEACEVEAWGHPTFRINKKIFVACGNGDDGKASMNFKPDPLVREALLPREGFFVPAYVGTKGWLGMNLSSETDWNEVAALVTMSYRQFCLKRNLKALEEAHTASA
jgi:predicted DNA-binding protein (MmcQ/YjbR family)